MPFKPARPCQGRGPRRGRCPNLIRGDETCCPECKPYEIQTQKRQTRQYDKARDQTPGRKFIHSTTWRKIRESKLNRDPLCERCEKQGLTVPAVLVHHVDGDELNNDPSNHMSCCNSCHEIIHKGERWGR